MKKSFLSISRYFAIATFLLAGLAMCGLQMANQDSAQQAGGITINNDSISLGEAITYKNLLIFPIVARGHQDQVSYLTLSKALEQGKVVVKETGSVNQLQIDNLSDEYVFILAGDIVKGGRQDRTMGNDVIIAPKEKEVPLESYCVESGRWQQRGEEQSTHFSDNTKTLTSKDLKLASRYQKDQSEVWQKVSEEQQKLNKRIGDIKGQPVEVKSATSETSLQLTLENKELEDIMKDYKNNLPGLNQLPDSTIGFAYAINGKLYSIDMYSDRLLFNNLKQKLFDAIIVEAISEFDNNLKYMEVPGDSVAVMLNMFSNQKGERIVVNKNTTVITTEAKDAVQFETMQTGDQERWVRKNCLVKGEKQAGEEQVRSYESQRME
jgi:hypothetical protein